MKKSVIILISVVSFGLGFFIEKESEAEIKREAINAASMYMDSILSTKNNLDILYVEKPYSKNIERPYTIKSKNGYISDARVAARIAVSIWSSLFGDYNSNKKCPIEVTLKDDSIWILTGTLLPNAEGGTPYIEISKQTGEILRVNRDK